MDNRELVSCEGIFSHVNQPINPDMANAIANGLCVDPASTVVEGSVAYESKQKFILEFEPCNNYSDNCADNSTISSWVKSSGLFEVMIFYSYSFTDLESIDEPFKQTLSGK